MGHYELREKLRRSLARQEALLRGSLVLNPVENFPFPEDIEPTSSPLHGLYNTDKVRPNDAKRDTVHQFAGRDRLAYDSRRIYSAWAEALCAADVSMRLLSGLQAHAAIFMAITKPGDKVLLLPETAGGHMATKGILERLGLEIVEIAINRATLSVDTEATLASLQGKSPGIVFIDRSEGLIYEDFSDLISRVGAPTVYDGSQYLTHILAGHYRHPFEMGADLFISTVHKNFPGPQKALVATRKDDDLWMRVRSGLSAYVSNMHVASTYAAGLTLARSDWLVDYSARMLGNVRSLDQALFDHGVKTVLRSSKEPPTHHIWIGPVDRDTAFSWFKRLERDRIYVNYRLLPYGLGYGLRLGLAAVTRLGLEPSDADKVASFVAQSIKGDESPRRRVRNFAESLWKRDNL